MDGVIIVDKPQGWTSHDVVGKCRRIFNTKSIGHLGTLDPLATGVLPLVVGRATRLSQFYTRSDKVYEGTAHFGFSTTSYDCDGAPTSEPREITLDAAELETLLTRFRGSILQTPPAVSAKKVNGRRAYDLARKSLPVELPAVPVEIQELTALEVAGADARLRVRCSGGTYVRSIVHDLGQAMGCGAHLTTLRRLGSGEFHIENAHTIAQLETLAAEDRLPEALIPTGSLLPAIPAVLVDDLTASQIRNGRNFQTSPFRPEPSAPRVKAVTREGQLVAIGEAVLPHVYHPAIVL